MALFQYFTPAIFIFLAIKYFNKSPKTSVTLSSVSAVVSAVMFPLAWYLGLFAGVEGGTHRSYAYLVFIFMLLLAILELVLSLIQKKNKAAMKII
jgi:predicted branched-subunit amino acid permease